MPMKPHKDESQSEFMQRCVPDLMGDGKREQEQAVAACLNIWREDKKSNGKAGFVSISPEEGEDYQTWMARCTPECLAHGGEGFSEEHAEAQCSIIWEENQVPGRPGGLHNYIGGKQKQMEPQDDESHDDFIDRCMDEYGDDSEERCETIWADARDDDNGDRAAKGIRKKTHAETVNHMEFVLSDETPDRMGDIIECNEASWVLENFRKNPIALFNHRADFVIGKWHDLRIETQSLRGHLELAPKGTSPRIDEIRRLIDAGILKAVSVGFRPIDSTPINPKDMWGGQRFTKQELVETSLVSVPANPNALAVAKSLNISTDTLDLVFAKPGSRGQIHKRSGATGKPAATPPHRKGKAMEGLAKRITDGETRLVALQDQLEVHIGKLNDENVSDTDMQMTSDLNSKIATASKHLDLLKETEKRLGANSVGPADHETRGNGEGETERRAILKGSTALTIHNPRPFAAAAKKIVPLDYLWRSLTVQCKHHTEQHKRPILDILKEEYGEDEPTRAVMQTWGTRAASVPATIPQAGWAAELVTQVWMDFLEALLPFSVFTGIASRGESFTFGRNGVINLPMRLSTPQISGSFVGEGAPIPVRQGQFASVQLTPKKMAVISTFTREIAEHSTPAIEGLIREAIIHDTAIALDSVLLDNMPATAVRPAGLRYNVTPLTPTVAGAAPVFALIGDIKQMVGALQAITYDNIRAPVWVTTPQLAKSASLATTTIGDTPFREEVNGGELDGYPMLKSTSVPTGTIMLLDAADFASVTDAAPRFDVSDQAVLHMEDTTPLAIASGSPGTVASPARSLWQTDTIGIRMIYPMNWIYRRAGMVVELTSPTWA